jgi:hypothetical protein
VTGHIQVANVAMGKRALTPFSSFSLGYSLVSKKGSDPVSLYNAAFP